MIRCGVSLHTKSHLGFAKTDVRIYQNYYEEHIVVQAVKPWIQMYLKKKMIFQKETAQTHFIRWMIAQL